MIIISSGHVTIEYNIMPLIRKTNVNHNPLHVNWHVECAHSGCHLLDLSGFFGLGPTLVLLGHGLSHGHVAFLNKAHTNHWCTYGWSHAVDLYHLKIRDNGRQIWTPGQSGKFRDNPGNPGTVGKYAYDCSINLLCMPSLSIHAYMLHMQVHVSKILRLLFITIHIV